EDKYDMDEFVDKHILVGEELKDLLRDRDNIKKYMGSENKEIELSMYIYGICSEYFAITKGVNLNPFMKKISFKHDSLEYKICMMEEKQISDIASANYGNHLIAGGSGTGKSSLLLGRAIKLSKIYPHHKFLILAFTKQQLNMYKEMLEILNVDTSN